VKVILKFCKAGEQNDRRRSKVEISGILWWLYLCHWRCGSIFSSFRGELRKTHDWHGKVRKD